MKSKAEWLKEAREELITNQVNNLETCLNIIGRFLDSNSKERRMWISFLELMLESRD